MEDIFKIGVVEEIIVNPLEFVRSIDRYTQYVSDASLIEDVPPNTALVRITTDREYNTDQKLEVCYPLFPSQLQLPVKAGNPRRFISLIILSLSQESNKYFLFT